MSQSTKYEHNLLPGAKILSVYLSPVTGIEWVLHTRGGGLADNDSIDMDGVEPDGERAHRSAPTWDWIRVLQERFDSADKTWRELVCVMDDWELGTEPDFDRIAELRAALGIEAKS